MHRWRDDERKHHGDQDAADALVADTEDLLAVRHNDVVDVIGGAEEGEAGLGLGGVIDVEEAAL